MQKCCRRFAGFPARNRPRIIFNSRTSSHFLEHFDIISSASFQPFGFEHFSLRTEFFNTLFHFFLNSISCTNQLFFRYDKVFCRIKNSFIKFASYITIQNIKSFYSDYLFPIKFNAVCFVSFHVRRINFYYITFYSKISSVQNIIISLILK